MCAPARLQHATFRLGGNGGIIADAYHSSAYPQLFLLTKQFLCSVM